MQASRFNVIVQADPQALIRTLNAFAQLGLMPCFVNAVEADGLLTICIEQNELGEQQARIIAEKMRSSFLVKAIRVHRGPDILLSHNEANHEFPACSPLPDREKR